MSYVYVACTVVLTVYGQLVIKWQVLEAGAFPEAAGEKMLFLVPLLSVLLFHEPVTAPKAIGLALIVAGIVIGGQG